MAEIFTSETPWLLEQWARWARINQGLTLHYPCLATFTKFQGKASLAPDISDQEAIAIDRIVSKLRHRDTEMGDAVILYYFSGSNLSYVARELGMDRRKADVLVKSGTAWVDAIAGSLEAA